MPENILPKGIIIKYRPERKNEENLMKMNFIVTLDAGANEIENLLSGTKSMIIRGADEKCIPYGIVHEGDILYFTYNNNCKSLRAKAVVSSVYNSCQLSEEESYEVIIRNQGKLSLPDNLFYKWAGKKYLILIGIKEVKEIKSGFPSVSQSRPEYPYIF